MKFQLKTLLAAAAAISSVLLTASCEKADSAKPWGNALIYMPQANYSPYTVPNAGDATNVNQNWKFENDRVLIFLGVYRAGLEELEEYSVNISTGTEVLENTTLLPASEYTLPSSVTCPAGKRDATFYLSVDLAFLQANSATDYSLRVTISDPSRYSLNESLCSTDVFIDTDALLGKLTE